MTQMRLFWISIVVVELVLLYVVWRPHRDQFLRPAHRIAAASPTATPPVVPPPANKPSTNKPAAALTSRALLPLRHGRTFASAKSLVVNASLKSPEPIRTIPKLGRQTPLSPLEPFWCDLAKVGSDCDDCEVKNEQARK